MLTSAMIKSGRDRKVYMDFQKARHNGEVPCKNGTLTKIILSEGIKTGQLACIQLVTEGIEKP